MTLDQSQAPISFRPLIFKNQLKVQRPFVNLGPFVAGLPKSSKIVKGRVVKDAIWNLGPIFKGSVKLKVKGVTNFFLAARNIERPVLTFEMEHDSDLALARALQAQFDEEDAHEEVSSFIPEEFRFASPAKKRKIEPSNETSIIAPEWEDLDPTPGS